MVMNREHIIHIFIVTSTLVSAMVWTAHGKQERGALSYVVQRGCPYLSRYVRENYFIYDESETKTAASVPTAVNWVTYTYDRCSTEYVPIELFHGLVNCGKEYALYAVRAPTALIEILHVDFNNVPALGQTAYCSKCSPYDHLFRKSIHNTMCMSAAKAAILRGHIRTIFIQNQLDGGTMASLTSSPSYKPSVYRDI